MNLIEGTVLAAKVLAKSMDMAKPDANKFEIGVVTRDADTGAIFQKRVEGALLQSLLTEANVLGAPADAGQADKATKQIRTGAQSAEMQRLHEAMRRR